MWTPKNSEKLLLKNQTSAIDREASTLQAKQCIPSKQQQWKIALEK